MAGAMRKMGIYLGLVDDGREDEEYYDEEEGQLAGPRRWGDRLVATRLEPEFGDETEDLDREAAVATQSYRIITLHPRTYNEARTIGEHFRDDVPVIMNLTDMEDSEAKRLVDFAAGLTFGLRGSIERVTNKVFLLSPQNIRVTAEDKMRAVAEGGFFNQS